MARPRKAKKLLHLICLKCRQKFPSRNKASNRLCVMCNEENSKLYVRPVYVPIDERG